jgi:hypothetical protein
MSLQRQTMTTQAKFYCNIGVLTSEERMHHKQLTDKLIAARQEIVESEQGYAFRVSLPRITIGELAEWVSAESKCYPFFDFHIDLEREGSMLCLRLTGAEGIKAFIRSEFHIAEK